MKQFYRILLAFTCFLLFLTNSLKADHMVGYDMTMISLGNDLYKFRVVAYRDVLGIPIQNSFYFNIYKNSDNSAAPTPTFVASQINYVAITYDPKDCPPAGADLRLEKYTYESPSMNMSAFNSASGYYVTASTCCRNVGVTNVLNSSLMNLQ